MEKSPRRVSHDLNNNNVSKMPVKYGNTSNTTGSIGSGGLNNPRGLANLAYVESLDDPGSTASSVHDMDFNSTHTNPKAGFEKYSDHDMDRYVGMRNSFKRRFCCKFNRTFRIAISSALISFGFTILIGGMLIYLLKDVDIGATKDSINCTTTGCEVLILGDEENFGIFGIERRLNNAIGSMMMACGGLAILIGVSILLTPYVRNEELKNIAIQSRKKLSSVVYFNRKDIDHLRNKLEKYNGKKSDEEPKVSHL